MELRQRKKRRPTDCRGDRCKRQARAPGARLHDPPRRRRNGGRGLTARRTRVRCRRRRHSDPARVQP
jgi:hypothetical protein